MHLRREQLPAVGAVVLTCLLLAAFVPAGGLAVCVSEHGHVEIISAADEPGADGELCPCDGIRANEECRDRHCGGSRHSPCRDFRLEALPEATSIKVVESTWDEFSCAIHRPLPGHDSLWVSRGLGCNPAHRQRWSRRTQPTIAGEVDALVLRSVVLLI